MGSQMPKPVQSVVLKRQSGTGFRVGLAEMNGWRLNMEDAHVIHCEDDWGFFGVFDGHGGSQCSTWIAHRFTEELAKGMPEDDASVKALALRLDAEFLATKQPSGSTGTFVIVTSAKEEGGKISVRVGNIGDSRVLLGRADGSIYEGPGTDSGLTTDHKPDHPMERERIERTGGKVQDVMGVARVNGDLAVSRAFGDAAYKETGGPGQEDHPVSAEPELNSVECDSTDFLLLVCDGISEGNFPNREVVELAAAQLRSSEKVDPAMAAAAVCRKALDCGSKDNLTCMIVLFGGGEISESHDFLPGPYDAPESQYFQKAYTDMAEHVGLNLEQAVEKRYDFVREELKNPELDEEKASMYKAELARFGEGPGSELEVGSEERLAWFRNWCGNSNNQSPHLEPSEMRVSSLLEKLKEHRDAKPKRVVRLPPLAQLRPAIETHPALKWDDRHAETCGVTGWVMEDDDADGTSKVKFGKPLDFQAWFPTEILIPVEADDSISPVA